MKRSEVSLSDHQAYHVALTDCHECMNDFGHRMDSYSNMTGGRAMLEQRLGKLDLLLASRQDGEIKISIMLGKLKET